MRKANYVCEGLVYLKVSDWTGRDWRGFRAWGEAEKVSPTSEGNVSRFHRRCAIRWSDTV